MCRRKPGRGCLYFRPQKTLRSQATFIAGQVGFLTKGKIGVRGGEKEGVVSATGPRYGYEACNAHHYETLIPEDSEIYDLPVVASICR